MKVISVDYLGNGSGFGSKSFWLDFADKYTKEQFSKQTLPVFIDRNFRNRENKYV